MPPIVTTAEIDRPADRLFACATDPSLFPGPGKHGRTQAADREELMV